MTEYGGNNGWTWDGVTVLNWSVPTGCAYSQDSIPIGNAAYNGLNLCAGAKIGITGGVWFPSGTATLVQIWLVDCNGNYITTLATASLNGGYGSAATGGSFSAPYYGSTAYTIPASGCYGFAAVYYDSNGNGPYGAVLETDVNISLMSSASDPTITIQSNSYFTGVVDGDTNQTAQCSLTGGSCTFLQGYPTQALFDFVMNGGSPSGTDLTLFVQYSTLGYWSTIQSADLGTVMPNESGSVSQGGVSFTMGSTGQYRLGISFNSVQGQGVVNAYSTPVTLTAGTYESPASDLVITSGPSMSKTQISPGGTANISVTIKNNGTSPSVVATLILTASSGDPGWSGTQVSIPSINPASSYTATGIYAASQQASGTVSICATIQ